MACRGTDFVGNYVVPKNKRFIPWSVENKVKLVFGMILHDSFERFVGEPSNPLEFVFKQ